MQNATMEERKDPEFIQFMEGQVVTGVLVGIERIQVNGKPVARYTLSDEGKLVSFLGTYQINSKIRPQDSGHMIEVRCEGYDPTVTKNGNQMRKFRIFVSKEKETGAPVIDLGITDDDVPF